MLLRTILLSAIAIALFSCGNKNKNGTDPVNKDAEAAASVPAPSTNFKTDDLLGAWMAVEGDCFAEEINFDPEGTFSSYLHAKPFSNGTWTFENNCKDG
jgi:hypothetical protein